MESLVCDATLPLDVVQIVLGYVQDAKALCSARLSCKAWRQAASAAPCILKVALPSSTTDMKAKLALLLQLMPGVSGLQATVAAGSDPAYTSQCFQDLLAFKSLRQLDFCFADSHELVGADIANIAAFKGLTCLRMSNVSLPAGIDSSPLTALQGLREVSLVHHSKVSALMVGDSHLQTLGRLVGLQQLVLQGRMCSATDEGLMALAALSQLSSLSISWVPWQSQITQHAALQLLSVLPHLKSLHLGGAELLLPSTPYYPAGAGPGPSPASTAASTAVLGIGIVGPQHGLIAAAVAAVAGARGDVAARPAAGLPLCAGQGDYMRTVLGKKAEDLEAFKLQFNCCGTGVEKALLSLGDIRQRLTGVQWSYAKLSGPSSVSLLASCTNLRSLKLRLWYQDYNLTPFEFSLVDLSTLVHLRTLVIDKRPPFQQQLPAQQSAISLPVTTPVLAALSKAWPLLEKLQLGLARSDFGSNPLEGLAGFTNLKSLSVHCYDQGYDDGNFMLPINVAALPSSLVKLDLMHAELFSSNGSIHGADCNSSSSSSNNACCSISTSLQSFNSSSLNCRGYSRSEGGYLSSASSGSLASKSGSSSSSAAIRVTFGAASALTSMLSESFSLLSRQASAECSTAYLDRVLTQQEDAAASADHASTTAAVASAVNSLESPFSTARSGLKKQNSNGWLQELLGDSSGSSSRGRQAGVSCNTSSTSSLLRQQSLPPLPKQPSMPHPSKHSSPRVAPTQQPSCLTVMAKHTAKVAPVLEDPALTGSASSLAPAGDAGGSSSSSSVTKPRLQNPFAAAAAAAAVHASMGGCVAAVDPVSLEAVAAAAAAAGPLLPLMTDPAAAAAPCSSNGNHNASSRGGSNSGSILGRSFSMSFGSRSKVTKHGSAPAISRESSGYPWVDSPGLPSLQHLQLKHCALDGMCMDDVITAPGALRSLQLVEVTGLSPRDIALLPCLANCQRLTLIAAKEDAWLGLAPLRLLCKLPQLHHLDWVVSERALPKSSKCTDLQALLQFPRLQVITLHTVLGKCEQLHAVSAQLQGGCHVRLMAPAYCEHASRRSGSKISRLLGAASCLLPGAGY